MVSRKQWVEYCPQFAPEELLSPGGLRMFEATGQVPISPTALSMLKAFRERLGVPLIVNHGTNRLRGYRTHTENAAIPGSATFSFHMLGMAFDISSKDISVEKIYQEAIAFGWTGVGIYDTWVHVDNRLNLGEPVTWDLRKSH